MDGNQNDERKGDSQKNGVHIRQRPKKSSVDFIDCHLILGQKENDRRKQKDNIVQKHSNHHIAEHHQITVGYLDDLRSRLGQSSTRCN